MQFQLHQTRALQRTISALFRPGDRIAGGTAGAIRLEATTGQAVGGRFHLQKGIERIRNLENILGGEELSAADRVVAERLLGDLRRAVPGHWEGDLLLGRHWTQLATVVERTTRFTVLVQLGGRDMATVTAGLSREMTKLPTALRRSLTWDRGMELADHKTVTANTGLDVYFADPRSPWQRGTNENTNRLLRQYFPTGTSMGSLTQDDLDAIAAKLNSRPRKTLDFETPAERMERLLR